MSAETLKTAGVCLILLLVIAYFLNLVSLQDKISRRIASQSEDGSAPWGLWMVTNPFWTPEKYKRMLDRDAQLKKYVERYNSALYWQAVIFMLLIFGGFIVAYIVKVHRWPWG